MEKTTLYALEKLKFTKIQRYKNVKFRKKPSVLRFKKVNFCGNPALYGLKTLDFGKNQRFTL
jgi:hypothetical protein